MTALIWMLTWLLQVLPAMSELPKPVNLTLTSVYFSHMLKWEPGPGTPTGVHYVVTVITERGLDWVPVAGCEHVQHPLVCNLTGKAFSDPDDNYFIKVTAMLAGQHSSDSLRFSPKENTQLDMPLLTMTPCDRHLCVHLQPPREHLRKIYETFSYKLRIKCDNADNIEQDTKLLRSQILKNLIPGRECCVSVRFSVSVVHRMSNYSQPVCAVTLGSNTAEPWISIVPCLFVIFCLVITALLFSAGFIRCLIKNPLPLVLTSIHHLDEVLIITPRSASLSTLLKLKPTPPSSGEKRHSHTSSCDSDSETKRTGSSRGGGEEHYKLRVGTTLLSSSSSSSSSLSSLSAPLSPEPEPTPSFSSNQASDFVGPQPAAPMETGRSASDPPASCSTRGRVEPNKKEQEEQVVWEEAGSLDVNLLTLTFGPHKDEMEEEEKFDVESSSASEVCITALIPPAQTWDTEEVALETIPCSVIVDEDEEDEEEEEEEEDSGYMGRPSAQVLQNLL